MHEKIYDRFVERVLVRVAAIKQGDPLDPSTMIGAQASSEQLEKILSYIDIGKQVGAQVLAGGARTILGWRDDLVEAGWRPQAHLGRKRLTDIAAAEEAGPDLPFGRPDRLRAAIDALAEPRRLQLQSVTLIDDHALLPVGWRGLAAAGEKGV